MTGARFGVRWSVPAAPIVDQDAGDQLTEAAVRVRDEMFPLVLVPHLGLYALAAAGMLLRRSPAGRARLLSVPYYFTLVNLAAFLGVVSILRGERRRAWSPRRGLET